MWARALAALDEGACSGGDMWLWTRVLPGACDGSGLLLLGKKCRMYRVWAHAHGHIDTLGPEFRSARWGQSSAGADYSSHLMRTVSSIAVRLLQLGLTHYFH